MPLVGSLAVNYGKSEVPCRMAEFSAAMVPGSGGPAPISETRVFPVDPQE
jgi:hypothetical protein